MQRRNCPMPRTVFHLIRDANIWVDVKVVFQIVAVSVGPCDVVAVGVGANAARKCHSLPGRCPLPSRFRTVDNRRIYQCRKKLVLQESPAGTRVTSDNSACIKAPKE